MNTYKVKITNCRNGNTLIETVEAKNEKSAILMAEDIGKGISGNPHDKKDWNCDDCDGEIIK